MDSRSNLTAATISHLPGLVSLIPCPSSGPCCSHSKCYSNWNWNKKSFSSSEGCPLTWTKECEQKDIDYDVKWILRGYSCGPFCIAFEAAELCNEYNWTVMLGKHVAETQ